MARHRRRHRYGAIEVVPGLGDVMHTFKQPVKGTDIVVGGLSALAGIYVVKKVINKWFVGKLPPMVLNLVPAISGVVAGTGLFFIAKKMGKGAHAAGLAVGAVSAGIAINAMNYLKLQFPELADLVDLRLSGIILNDPAVRRALPMMQGIVMDDRGYLGGTDFRALAAAGEESEGMMMEVG